MKNIYFIILVFLLSACASPKRDDYVKHQTNSSHIAKINTQNLSIVLEPETNLDFRGLYDSDRSIDSPQMLYYGPGDLIGHAIAISAMKEEKLKAQQAKADQILAPINSVLTGINQSELIPKESKYSFNQKANYLVHSRPIFFFSSDLKSMSVKHVISIINPEIKNKKKRTVYQNIVEVLSTPIIDESPSDFILANNGSYINDTAKTLYEDSLELALNNLDIPSTPMRQINHKFYQGNKERFERGIVLDENCETTVIRNLRGWLISYPTSAKKHTDLIESSC